MAVLTPGKPFDTAKPTLVVENRLAVGTYRFRLVAIDDEGNESLPVFHTLKVVGLTRNPFPENPVRTP